MEATLFRSSSHVFAGIEYISIAYSVKVTGRTYAMGYTCNNKTDNEIDKQLVCIMDSIIDRTSPRWQMTREEDETVWGLEQADVDLMESELHEIQLFGKRRISPNCLRGVVIT